MPGFSLTTALQLILALGLLNVWLLRASSSTSYRGGESSSLKEEFRAYGLPDWSFYAVGALKIGSALALLAGLWLPQLVIPAASVIAVLMLGALAMHLKVKDDPIKFVPAFLMLVMSVSLIALGAR